MLETPFTRLLRCPAPVQQAPMGAISGPALAVAVANSGGVGCIAALGMGPAQLEATLVAMTADTAGVLAVNFAGEEIDRDAVTVASERVAMVDFFWTDPDPDLVALVHGSGALACWQVGSVAEARSARDAGCDVIAVQGCEAGGHVRGDVPLLPLLDAVLDGVDVPVLAAGGITTGRALAATSPRARVLQSCIDAVSASTGDVVGSVTLDGETVALPRGAGMPPTPDVEGQLAAMPMYAGEGVATITTVVPAAQVIDELCRGAARRLSSAVLV
jgi:nitronate monooxygenase